MTGERETAAVAHTIHGGSLYQERARAALPLLVRQAHAQQPIYYSDLAFELRMRNPRNLNFVLGSIGQTMTDLSKLWKEEVPPIQALFVNKATGLPGEGVGLWLNERSFGALSRKQQRARTCRCGVLEHLYVCELGARTGGTLTSRRACDN